MRTAWNIVAVVAVANLIALAGFVGWLAASDRLDVDRARTLRQMLSRTITAEKEATAQAEAKAKAEREEAEAAKKAAQPPLTAEQRVSLRLEASELDQRRAERLRREVEDLQRALATERAALDTERAELSQQRAQFERLVSGNQAALNDQQFQKTLGVLVGLKPKEAVALIRQMLDGTGVASPAGVQANAASPAPSAPSEAGMSNVVSYLDAMEDKPRGKIMAELAKDDPKLATQLLDRLRQRAQFAAVPKEAP